MTHLTSLLDNSFSLTVFIFVLLITELSAENRQRSGSFQSLLHYLDEEFPHSDLSRYSRSSTSSTSPELPLVRAQPSMDASMCVGCLHPPRPPKHSLFNSSLPPVKPNVINDSAHLSATNSDSLTIPEKHVVPPNDSSENSDTPLSDVDDWCFVVPHENNELSQHDSKFSTGTTVMDSSGWCVVELPRSDEKPSPLSGNSVISQETSTKIPE